MGPFDIAQNCFYVSRKKQYYKKIAKYGGFSSGGLNMDAKLRRQSIDPEDLFYAHIGSMDTCARALIAVEKMIDKTLEKENKN